ncbi:hypothetical protein ACYU03_22520 [Pseudomonas sp. X10]
MKLISVPIMLIGVALATSCTTQNNTTLSTGERTAEALQRRYDSSVQSCGKDSPAYDCSGIILRSTGFTEGWHAWDPSDSSIESGGVSFTYLRQDATFTDYVIGHSGLVFHASGEVPDGKKSIDVLCSYPVNADTNWRTQNGCGGRRGEEEIGRPCGEQGVIKASQWMTHFIEVARRQARNQCGFSLGPDKVTRAEAIYNFSQSMEARLLFKQQGLINNELRLALWPRGIPDQLPLQAIFYGWAGAASKALEDAMNIQRDFYVQSGGIKLPVIRIEHNVDGRMLFMYREQDQSIVN